MIKLIQAADDNGERLQAHLPAEEDTEALGRTLASTLRPGLQIWLQGNLGMGKTTLTRGVLRGLGYAGRVKSPTYTLIEPYVVSRLDLYHFDFYRFTSPEEFIEAGLDEYFSAQGVCLVEWPQKAAPYVSAPDIEIRLALDGDGREAIIRPLTEPGRQCTRKMAASPTP